MVFRHAIGRPILIALLLVVGLAAGVGLVPFGSGPLGPEVVSADSRCDQHYAHNHYRWNGIKIDQYNDHGQVLIGDYGYETHWTEHWRGSIDNVMYDQCDS